MRPDPPPASSSAASSARAARIPALTQSEVDDQQRRHMWRLLLNYADAEDGPHNPGLTDRQATNITRALESMQDVERMRMHQAFMLLMGHVCMEVANLLSHAPAMLEPDVELEQEESEGEVPGHPAPTRRQHGSVWTLGLLLTARWMRSRSCALCSWRWRPGLPAQSREARRHQGGTEGRALPPGGAREVGRGPEGRVHDAGLHVMLTMTRRNIGIGRRSSFYTNNVSGSKYRMKGQQQGCSRGRTG